MEFEKRVVDLDVNDVLPNRFQPRIKFNEDSINELCESIKEHGVIQPIVVRAMGDKYEIIAGERRYKASLLAGKQTIPAVITDLNDKDSAEVALIENVQRKDLTPIEEAISYKKILDMGYLTQEELATKLGKNQSTVANKLRLLNLDEEVQEAVLEEKISERHARSLLKLSNMEEQRKMLKKIVDNRLTVRKADEEINKILSGSENPDDSGDGEKVLTQSYEEEKEELENPFNISPSITEGTPTIDKSNLFAETEKAEEEPIIIIDDVEKLPIINEDQVTVNPVDEFNPFKMEELSSQEMPPIMSNIPSNPIEDVVQTTKEELPITENDNLAQNNPGFMDIEKIKEDAQDINKVEEKQPIDINSLLKPSVIGQEPVIEEKNIVNTQPIEEVKVGKFFTLPIEEEPVIMEEKKEIENNASLPDAFDFNIENQTLGVNDTIRENLPISENVEQKSQTNSSLDELLNINEIVSSSPIVSTPLEINDNQELPNNIDMPIVNEEAPAPIASEDLTNNLVNPDFDFNISAPIEREEVFSSPVIPSDEMPIPALTTNTPTNSNINGALEIIRNNVKQLESMGYIVDTEEFDFETAYQVIIKIEK